MSKVNKLLKTFAVFILMASIFTNVIGCGTTSVERVEFKGNMSVVAYEQVEDAARAFFEEQINCSGHEDCVFSAYSPKKELTSRDVSDLELGDYTTDDILWAEKGKVSFAYGNEVFANSVYILQTEEGYHYYSLLPEDEEAVTSDYYEFLLNEENYANATVIIKSMVIVEEDGLSRQNDINLEFLYQDGKIKFDLSLKTFFNGGVSETVLSGYVLVVDEYNIVYGLNEKGEYVDISYELIEFFKKENNPYVYYTSLLADVYKGGAQLFKVNEETLVLKEKEKSLLADTFIQEFYGDSGAVADALSCIVSLEDKKVSSVYTSIHTINEEANQNLYIAVETSISKIGKTEFEIPEEITSLLEESESEQI